MKKFVTKIDFQNDKSDKNGHNFRNWEGLQRVLSRS